MPDPQFMELCRYLDENDEWNISGMIMYLGDSNHDENLVLVTNDTPDVLA